MIVFWMAGVTREVMRIDHIYIVSRLNNESAETG